MALVTPPLGMGNVCPLANVTPLSNFVVPLTSSLARGFEVPMPTLLSDVILTASLTLE